jgi:glucose/arabinose dehydrogenase
MRRLRRISRPAARRLAPWSACALLALGLSACTFAPKDVTGTAATFWGIVWSQGKPTTYWFEYGTTTSYGQTTAVKDAGSGASAPVQERVAGLSPGTTYHVRLCQQNSDGRTCHADQSFSTKQPGFQEEVALSGLELPTAFAFAPDGRVFVAEKRGVIRVFDSLNDATPATFADLRTEVYSYSDRGLLGMALDPAFPSRPYVYVAYHHDALPGGAAPHYGSPGAASDPCPDAGQSCPSDGRVSRLTAAGNQAVSEKVLVDDYCFQYDSHSVGQLQFGPDGALYASAGDGSSYNFADYGQAGNPCGDPPAAAGTNLTAPTAEGGSLRSQDLRTGADPAGLDGAIIRIHPDTGAPFGGNPLAADRDPNAQRIIAYGLRNPYRFTIRPGTGEVWVGDVGWGEWEEVNRIANPTAAPVRNFGWPCYQGNERDAGYESAGLNLCANLYAQPGAAAGPYFTYRHSAQVVAGEPCPSGSSAIAGLAFKPAGVGNYPTAYDGALFFSDYARGCIWAMKAGAGGLPDPARIETFQQGPYPVDLVFGPGGDLFYSSIATGTIRRIRYFTGNTPPSAEARATPSFGPVPLQVSFDATGSRDRDEEPLSFAWDLDDDGQFDDSTAAKPARTFTQPGNHRVTCG